MLIRIRVLTIWHGLEQRPALLSGAVFLVALAVYVPTLAPGLLWGGGDFAAFQTFAYTGEGIRGGAFGHSLWVILVKPFVLLPIRDVAFRANLAAAAFGAATMIFVLLSALEITRSAGASLLATGTLMLSHTMWTYSVMPKVYSLNTLLLAACLYLLLRWRRERRGRYLYVFSTLYGLSLLNHLVMATAALGFAVFVLALARRSETPLTRQIVTAAVMFAISLAPYVIISAQSDDAGGAGSTVAAFIGGLGYIVTSPEALLIGLAAGMALLIYQFPLTFLFGLAGLRDNWRDDRPTAVLLTLIALGDALFLLGALDPRTGGAYVWNLHYYLQVYVVFALWIAMGLARRWPHIAKPRARLAGAIAACLALPIALYAATPALARPFLSNVPGFRELPGRDNLTYVLSPWKHNETGSRRLGERIFAALPADSVLFADYSLWAMLNYLQIVESARRDVELVLLPADQLAAIQARAGNPNLFLADRNRYYDIEAIQAHFEIVPEGPVFRLIAQ